MKRVVLRERERVLSFFVPLVFCVNCFDCDDDSFKKSDACAFFFFCGAHS